VMRAAVVVGQSHSTRPRRYGSCAARRRPRDRRRSQDVARRYSSDSLALIVPELHSARSRVRSNSARIVHSGSVVGGPASCGAPALPASSASRSRRRAEGGARRPSRVACLASHASVSDQCQIETTHDTEYSMNGVSEASGTGYPGLRAEGADAGCRHPGLPVADQSSSMGMVAPSWSYAGVARLDGCSGGRGRGAAPGDPR